MNAVEDSVNNATARNSLRRRVLLLGAGLWLFYLAFLPPGQYSVDANSMLAVSESLVARHTIAVPEGLGIPGRNGQIYSIWYPLLSVLGIPFAYAALFASRISGLPFHYVAAVFVSLVPGALTAATASLIALISLRLGSSWRGASSAALCFAFGTVALVYARTFLADPLLAFVTVFALYLAMGLSPRDLFGAALLSGLAVLAKPTGVVVGPVLSAYLIAKRVPWRLSVLPALGTVLGLALYAVYNIVRFVNPLNFGQPSIFRLSAIPSGIAGQLASPGWGMIWYCPVAVLVIAGARKAWQQHRWEVLAIAAIFFSYLLLHSYYEAWYAGWSWGPRYLLPGLAAMCPLLGRLEGSAKKAAALLALLGFLINAPTLFTFYERYYSELTEQGIPVYPALAWSFRLAPFAHEWPAAIRQVQDASKADVREIFAQRGAPSKTVENSRALRVVAVWWWVLPLAHIPRAAGAIASVLMLLVGGGLIVTAGRESARACSP